MKVYFAIACIGTLFALQSQCLCSAAGWTSSVTTTSSTKFTATLTAYVKKVTQTQTAVLPLPPVPTRNGSPPAKPVHIDLVHIDIYNQTNIIQQLILPFTCAILGMDNNNAFGNGNTKIVAKTSTGRSITFNLNSVIVSNQKLTGQVSQLIHYLNTTSQLQLPFGNNCNDCSGKQIVLSFLQLIVSVTKVTQPHVDIQSSDIVILQAVVQVFEEIDQDQWYQLLSAVLGTKVNNSNWLGQLGQYFLAIFLAIIKNTVPVTAQTVPPPTVKHRFSLLSQLHLVSGHTVNLLEKTALSVPKGIGGAIKDISGNIHGLLKGIDSSHARIDISTFITSIKYVISQIVQVILSLPEETLHTIIRFPRQIIEVIKVIVANFERLLKRIDFSHAGTDISNVVVAIKHFIANVIKAILSLPKSTIKAIKLLSAGVEAKTGQIVSTIAHSSGLILPAGFTKFFHSGGSVSHALYYFGNISTFSASTVLPCIVQQLHKLR